MISTSPINSENNLLAIIDFRFTCCTAGKKATWYKQDPLVFVSNKYLLSAYYAPSLMVKSRPHPVAVFISVSLFCM